MMTNKAIDTPLKNQLFFVDLVLEFTSMGTDSEDVDAIVRTSSGFLFILGSAYHDNEIRISTVKCFKMGSLRIQSMLSISE